MQRGIAVIAIILHHWLYYLQWEKSSYLVDVIVGTFIGGVSGTFVHLFFVISGCGLTIAYFENRTISWRKWAKKRFLKIIIPYWIVVTSTFIMINLINYTMPTLFKNSCPWFILLTYLSFLQNFIGHSQDFNGPLWFIPVIIGLYMLFPVLIFILNRHGIAIFTIISALITYLSISLSIYIGYPVDHGHAIFAYYLIEFSFGMTWAYIIFHHQNSIHMLKGYNLFFIGIIFYLISWSIKSLWAYGNEFNDIFTAVGLFFITLPVCQLIGRIAPKIINYLNYCSDQSYLMYLIHGPIIIFVLTPIMGDIIRHHIIGTTMIVLACFYCLAIFLLAKLIAPLIKSLTLQLQWTDR